MKKKITDQRPNIERGEEERDQRRRREDWNIKSSK